MTQSTSPQLVFPPFRLPADVDLLYRGDAVVPLEPQAVRVLRYLAQHNERVIAKEEILEQVWPNVFTTDGVLKKAISQARRALGDDAEDSRFIVTYHGRGYRFIAPVTRLDAVVSPTPESAPDPVSPAAAIAAEAPDPDYDQLVGREAELAVLCAEYRRTLEGAGRPVLVIGEPGIGKTQLARRFQLWAREQGALCLSSRFFDYRASRLAPYEIFLDFLREALDLGAATLNELRAEVERRWGVVLPEELSSEDQSIESGERGEGGVAPDAGRVRGSTGAFARDNFRAVVPLSRCFTKLSRERPLVMVFDDLQWADSASRDLIGYLMRTIESEPLMILGLVRRGGTIDPQHPLAEWMRLQANYRSYTGLTLKALDENFCRAALEAIFGGAQFAPDITPMDLKTLYRMTGGNPYFLIEVVRLLVAEAAIVRGGASNPRWQWRGMQDLRLPESVVQAAQNKLDRLSGDVRTVAEEAAVLGEEFRLDVLASMDGRSEAEIADLLDDGVRRGVLSDRGMLSGEDYRFYHATLRRVLYNNLAPRRRRELHARAASAFGRVYAREPDRVAGALSTHYEVAGDFDATLAWSLRAWRASRSRGNWNEAVASLERAGRAMDALVQRGDASPDDTDHLTLLIGLGEGYSSIGRTRDAEEVLNEAFSLAERLGLKTAKAAVLLQQGQARLAVSQYREANELTRQALDIYRQAGDEEGEILSRIQLGAGEVALGNYGGLAGLMETLESRPASGHIAVIAWGLVGWAQVLQGSYTEGIAALERALGEQERTGDLHQRALLERRLAWAHFGQGRYDRAWELAERARDDYRRVGDLLGEARAHTELGLVRIAQGNYGEGLELVGKTLDALRLVADAHCEAEALWALGRAHLGAGRRLQAATLLERALGMLRTIGDRDDEMRVLTDLARLHLAEANAEAAAQSAEEAMTIAAELGARDALGLAMVESARAQAALERSERALMEAERAVVLLEETGSGERWRADETLAGVVKERTR